ncbi:unnamed protein product [Arctia plantaginis]|uniref:Uncharacterized protein n=1 Tax=Arctia plantaginis TaxID=874455 RepID=A0A8S0Z3J4_ARCPL|nr:unnamed protein product [Arctia plantaginis]
MRVVAIVLGKLKGCPILSQRGNEERITKTVHKAKVEWGAGAGRLQRTYTEEELTRSVLRNGLVKPPVTGERVRKV